MKTRYTLIPALTAAAVLLTTGAVQARGDSVLSQQAHNIERIGREVKNEFQTHYTRSSAYRHLMSDINTFLVKAEHIDQLSHDPRTTYRHIQADLAELDRLAHHLHELVDAIENGRYRGRIDGGLHHVHVKLNSMNAAIHSMQTTLVAYSRPAPQGCDVVQDSYGRGNVRYRTGRDNSLNNWSNFLRPLFEVNSGHGHSH
ncbi:MAG: hypothetical protein P1V20_09835 [Verrucomicrobiales bacterium]|nr:hypothetical protein [Verrucomicrobiales bacterium]